MKNVLNFIIEQGLDLSKYLTLIEPLRERFEIKDYDGNESAEQFITTVIFWEKHTEIYDSLEKFLNDKFIVKSKK